MQELTHTPQKQLARDPVSAINDWLPIDKFCEAFPNIPEKTVRWQLSNRFQNGLAPYVRVIGKQRYISVLGYSDWLNADRGTLSAAVTKEEADK